MRKMRLLFSKTGRAKYISHLDLMRTFQRVFLRAGIALRHTEGFNPHPYMAFALPLSVGAESVCELLDFDLASSEVPEDLIGRLNATMPEGIRALTTFESGAKFPDIKWLKTEGRFFYDNGADEGTVFALTDLFSRKELIVTKKSKKGPTEIDLAPHIDSIHFSLFDPGEIVVDAVISAQNPSLNPELLAAAAAKFLPADSAPHFASFQRLNIFYMNHKVFR